MHQKPKWQYKLSQIFAGITLLAIILAILRRPISCIEATNMIHGTIHGFIAPWKWILWFISIETNFEHSLDNCNGWAIIPCIISIIIQGICLFLFACSVYLLSYYTFKGKLPEPEKKETKTFHDDDFDFVRHG